MLGPSALRGLGGELRFSLAWLWKSKVYAALRLRATAFMLAGVRVRREAGTEAGEISCWTEGLTIFGPSFPIDTTGILSVCFFSISKVSWKQSLITSLNNNVSWQKMCSGTLGVAG